MSSWEGFSVNQSVHILHGQIIMHTVNTLLWFVVVWDRSVLPISLRVSSLALSQQAVPINGDNIPPLWSVPTPSRNTQQIVLFLSHCGSYTGENHSRKICLRRISAWLCPLECHGMEGIEAAVDTKSLGNVKKVFAKSCGNPDFRSIFGHQRAKIEGTNTKIDRGPETYPISINPRGWNESSRQFSRKVGETPIFGQFLATRGPKMRARTRKSIGVQRLTP